MSTYYFDSSGLVKYYVPEQGSSWVMQVFDARGNNEAWANVVAVSRIGIVEVAAAIAKRHRAGAIDTDERRQTFALFMHLAKTRLLTLPVSDAVLDSAAELTQRQPLREYDAVHLAAALALNRRLTAARVGPVTFVSADAVLLAAARAEGLAVHDPSIEA